MLPELRRQKLEFKELKVTIPERRKLCGESVPGILLWSPLEPVYTNLHMFD